jgi:hypothetical protein
MRAGGGKNKGSAFEREVCVILSEWMTAGERKDLFWRSSMSGGRATVHLRKGQTLKQCGDICAIDPEGMPFTDRYFIECKHVKNLQLHRFFIEQDGGPTSLWGYWGVANAEAEKYGKEPLVIARQNRISPVVVIRATEHLGSPKVPWLVGKHFKVCKLDDLVSRPLLTIGTPNARADHLRPSSERPSSRSVSPRVHEVDAPDVRKKSSGRFDLDTRRPVRRKG